MKRIKIKGISPYPENELWEKDEILAIVKYELYINNKKINYGGDSDTENSKSSIPCSSPSKSP